MARYIKANPKVAKFLNLENDRNTVKDGNYLLWQNDMLAFGPLIHLNETLVLIGGIALMAHEAKQEQDGTVTRELPTATDPRFVVEVPKPEENVAEPEENITEPEENITEPEENVAEPEENVTEPEENAKENQENE